MRRVEVSNHSDSPAECEWKSIAVAETRKWLERAVIGLNLCPFAKAVHVKGQVHYVVSTSDSRSELLALLKHELRTLQQTAPTERDTTLLILPLAMWDFLAFSHFLPDADRVLRKLGLEGELQIASFHPRFQFAGTEPDDITNYTNRAPYPTLHLLREASIAKAVAAFPDAESIFEKNMQTLEQLGHAGWRELGLVDDTTLDARKPSP
jgi:hypothetical protein